MSSLKYKYIWYQISLIYDKVKLIKLTIIDMILKHWASEKRWECCNFFLNCRHPYFYRDRYKLLCCPHVKGTGRELRPLTHFLSVCSFLKLQSFIWNISKDFQSILFSLYAEKILLIIAYFLLLSCNTFHAVLCQISMVWQFALDDYFVGDLPYFFYCLLFLVNVCICFFYFHQCRLPSYKF